MVVVKGNLKSNSYMLFIPQVTHTVDSEGHLKNNKTCTNKVIWVKFVLEVQNHRDSAAPQRLNIMVLI